MLKRTLMAVVVCCCVFGCIRAPEELDVLPVAAPATTRKVMTVPVAKAVVYTDTSSLISQVSIDYNTPAGAIYGIWSKESNRLISGWGDAKYWLPASDLAKKGSACAQIYGLKKCKRRYKLLETICSQKRQDGSKVCDPTEVRASYAMALGPMQHMPDVLIVEKGGKFVWNHHVVDYDKDGVIDPFTLPDAMAMTARHIRASRDKGEPWPRAVGWYYGSQKEGYYEGTEETSGVAKYWQDWCRQHKRCKAPRWLYASAD